MSKFLTRTAFASGLILLAMSLANTPCKAQNAGGEAEIPATPLLDRLEAIEQGRLDVLLKDLEQRLHDRLVSRLMVEMEERLEQASTQRRDPRPADGEMKLAGMLEAARAAIAASEQREQALKATIDQQAAELEQLRTQAAEHRAAIAALGRRTTDLAAFRDRFQSDLLNLTRLVERIAERR